MTTTERRLLLCLLLAKYVPKIFDIFYKHVKPCSRVQRMHYHFDQYSQIDAEHCLHILHALYLKYSQVNILNFFCMHQRFAYNLFCVLDLRFYIKLRLWMQICN